MTIPITRITMYEVGGEVFRDPADAQKHAAKLAVREAFDGEAAHGDIDEEGLFRLLDNPVSREHIRAYLGVL
jgi:hypothetical protein